MKNVLNITAAVLLMFAATAARADTDTCKARAQEILTSLQNNDYNKVASHFDARMQTAVPAEKLEQLWGKVLPTQVGTLEHAEKAQSQDGGNGNTRVLIPLKFAKAWINMQVVCSADNQVAGLLLKPGSAPPSATSKLSNNENPLPVKSPLGPLPGILTLPEAGKAPFPAVVLLAGSGPLDKDETIGPNKPLRDIAQGLAKRGIASLRYDKRTLVYGSEMADKSITVDDEVTVDALSAAHLLANQKHIDPKQIFLLGHSLGGLMAPRIGRQDPKLAGLILLAAPARLDLDVVLRQTRYLADIKHITGKQRAQLIEPIVSARDTLAAADPEQPPAGDFFHAPAGYWLDLMHYDAVAVAKKLKMPMLILQGQGDYQVTMKNDFSVWEKAFSDNPRVTLVSYPGLSHLFMPSGDPPSPADYEKADHVDPKVIEKTSQWIKAH